MQEVILYGVKAYITDVVNRGEYVVYKRGFCDGVVIPMFSDVKIKRNNKRFLPYGVGVIDLLYYGKLRKEGELYISEWYKDYRFVDGEELKTLYDAKRRFGGKFASNSNQTCLPFIRPYNGNIYIGLYSLDKMKIIVEKCLLDICLDENELRIHSQGISKLIG